MAKTRPSAHTKFKPIWLTLGILSLFSLFPLALLSIRFFSFGYHHQTELLTLLIWFIGALSWLWLAWGNQFAPRLIRKSFQYPIVWTFLLVTLFSSILCLFHPIKLLSFFGSPQLSEGGITFLALAGICALFITLLKLKKPRYMILSCAIFFGLLIATLNIIGSSETPFRAYRGWYFAPYWFPDYLGFMAIALSFIGYYLFKTTTQTFVKLISALILLSSALIFYFCMNKSLWYGAAIAGTVILGLKTMYKSNENIRDNLFKYTALCMVGVVTALCVAAYFNLPVPSTLLSRGTLNLYTFIGLFDGITLESMTQVLFGRGWGSYQEFVFPNIFKLNQASYYLGDTLLLHETFVRTFFHSHNILVEYFSALGLVGIILFFIKLFFITKSIQPKYAVWGGLYVLTYFILASFWFEMHATLPYTLLVLCLLSSPLLPKFGILAHLPTKKIFQVACALILLISLYPSFMLSCAFSKLDTVSLRDNILTESSKLMANPWIIRDQHFGAKRSTPFLTSLGGASIGLIKEEKTTPEIAKDVNLNVIEFLLQTKQGCGNLTNLIAAMNTFKDIATHEEIKPLFNGKDLKKWIETGYIFHKCVPQRPDVLIPLMIYLNTHGRRNRLKRLAQHLLDRNPADPVGLWFAGNLKLDNPATAQKGLRELKKAYENGINRFVPISAPLKDQLERIR